jgi:hypothetical protein
VIIPGFSTEIDAGPIGPFRRLLITTMQFTTELMNILCEQDRTHLVYEKFLE